MTSLLALLALAAAPPAAPALVEEPLLAGRPFVIRGHTDGVQALAYSPDGARLVTLGRDKLLIVWDPKTGARLASVPLPAQPSSLAFSADGQRLAVGSVELQVFLVDLAQGKVTQSVPHPDVCVDVAFSPDGRTLAVAGGSDTGALYLLDDPSKKVEFRGRSVAFSPDGKSLLVANGAGALAVLDAATAKVRKTLSPNEEKARALQTPDGTRLVSWSPLAPEVKVWSPAGKRVGTLSLPPTTGPDGTARKPRLSAVALARDGQRVLTSSTDGALRLWAVGEAKVLASWPIDSAAAVALSPDGAWVVAADGAVLKLWKTP